MIESSRLRAARHLIELGWLLPPVRGAQLLQRAQTHQPVVVIAPHATLVPVDDFENLWIRLL